MYKYKKQFGHMRHMGPIYTNNLNVNNVTNVAYLPGYCHHGKYKRNRRNSWGRREERPPKLFRYSASCGLLDQDVVARMSNEELLLGSAENMGYVARGFGSSVGRIANDVGMIGSGLLKIFTSIGDALFGYR